MRGDMRQIEALANKLHVTSPSMRPYPLRQSCTYVSLRLHFHGRVTFWAGRAGFTFERGNAQGRPEGRQCAGPWKVIPTPKPHRTNGDPDVKEKICRT